MVNARFVNNIIATRVIMDVMVFSRRVGAMSGLCVAIVRAKCIQPTLAGTMVCTAKTRARYSAQAGTGGDGVTTDDPGPGFESQNCMKNKEHTP